MKPKAALVKAGLKPADYDGRGRMSAADKELVKEVAAKHPEWNIEGYSVSKPVNSTDPVEVKQVKRDPSAVLDVPDEIRSENEWAAFISGKRIGMREVCRRCKNSFTYCWCEKPLYPVDFNTFGVVVFKPTASKEK